MEKSAVKVPIYENIISVRVDEKTFRVVMAVAHKYANGSMSEVGRLCILLGMKEVENYYERRKKFNEEFKL